MSHSFKNQAQINLRKLLGENLKILSKIKANENIYQGKKTKISFKIKANEKIDPGLKLKI